MISEGHDPIERRKAERAAKLAASAKTMTLAAAAGAYIKQHRAAWSPGHAHQWTASLDRHVLPVIGKLSVDAVETAHIRRVLDPLWHEKPETASRVRGRIEAVLGWAIVAGHRTKQDNPARWRGHLDKAYPAKAKVRPVEHQRAMAYGDMPSF
jgi:integrase